MKMKYDESDNALIRASRAVTDKMTDLIGERLLMRKTRHSNVHRFVLRTAEPGPESSALPLIFTRLCDLVFRWAVL